MVAVLQPLLGDWREKLDEIHLKLQGFSQCSGNLGLFYNLGEFPESQVQQKTQGNSPALLSVLGYSSAQLQGQRSIRPGQKSIVRRVVFRSSDWSKVTRSHSLLDLGDLHLPLSTAEAVCLLHWSRRQAPISRAG